jgi:hypothetical protein
LASSLASVLATNLQLRRKNSVEMIMVPVFCSRKVLDAQEFQVVSLQWKCGGGASGSGPVEAKLWPKCLSTFDPPLAVREARLTHLHKGRLGFPQAIISTKEIQAENRPNCLLLTSEIFWKANQSRWKRVLKAADFFAAHKLFRLMFRIRRCLRN